MKTKNIMITIFLFIVCSIYVYGIITPVQPLNPNTQITDTPFQTSQNTTTNINISVTNNITTINNFTTIINITNNISTMTQNNFSIINNITVVNNITNNISNNFYAGWLNTVYNVTNVINVTNNITFVVAEMTINITNNITTNNNYMINITLTNNVSTNVTIIQNIYNITNNFTVEYNDTSIMNKLNAINTTSNIQSLGFNTTTQLLSLFVPYTNAIQNIFLGQFNLSTNGTINSKGTYGEIFNSTNETTPITMTTKDVWYDIIYFQSGEMSGCVLINNNTLNVYSGGLYDISYTINGNVNNNDDIEMQLLVNGIVNRKGNSKMRYSNGLNEISTIRFLTRLNDNANITLQIRDLTRNGAVYTYYNKELIVNKIGN